MIEYQNMTALLENREEGAFRLERFSITPENRGFRNTIPNGDYIRLMGHGECVMSNTPMEKRTNQWFLHHAHGDVLIGGLGIGMIVLPIQEKDEVKSITILEKHPEVIKMVADQLPFNAKVRILQGDVYDYIFPKGTMFDSLYFDIWDYVNSEVYLDMKKLKRRYMKYKRKLADNPNAFIKCWAEREAKHNLPLF